MDNVKVKIFKSGYIPGIGTGPIRTPIQISRETYDKLKGLGFNIIIVEDPAAKNILKIKNDSVKKDETPVAKAKPVAAPVKKAEEIPVIKEEPIITTETTTEKEVEEENAIEESDDVLMNDKDLSPDSIYTEDFLTSKNICKKILNARKIQYNYHALYETLKELVLESNPKN